MAGRYEDDLPGDSPQLVDGDGFFIGVDSRTEPENLAPGIVSLAENMRFNQRKAVVRAGMEKQTNDISFTGLPLIVPFVLDATAILRVAGTDGIYESCVYSSQTTNLEYLAVATAESAFLFRPGLSVIQLNYPSGETIASTDQVDMFQVAGSVYILRGESESSITTTISRAGTTATATTSVAHGFTSGQYIRISGAYPSWYNGQFQITVTGATTFTFIVIGPTNLGDTLFEVATLNVHKASQALTLAASVSTYSVYAKPNGRNWCAVQYQDSLAVTHYSYFNVATGALGSGPSNATPAITAAGGGWYRCSITFTPAAGAGTVTVFAATADNTVSYLGDITKGTFFYGHQAEVASAPSGYTPTTATASTPNLLLYSEDMTNAVWVKSDATVSGNSTPEPATGVFQLARQKAPLRWDGNTSAGFVAVSQGTISAPYVYMPPSNFGLIMQNRAILQYARNKAIVSEVLAVEQYNSIYGVFVFRSGEADYLIGFHPYQENECIVFNRRSVYLLGGLDGGVELMTKAELTRQVGCVSRRSIATCGAVVLFLSDNGVYKLEPGLELQLRGAAEPLSAPIDNVMKTINTAAVQKSYGIYFDNRYYLAIATNGATRNNTMVIYNFLNQQWESKDTFPNGFYCDWMEVINDGVRDVLYLISLEGGVYAYEQLEFDEFGAADQDPAEFLIAGDLITRRMIFGDTDLKQFLRVSANVTFDVNSGLTIDAITTNPDATKRVSTKTSVTAEDMTIRSLVNMRGYGIQFQFQNTAGRMTVSNYRANAYTSDRKTITTQ